ncbi:MAG: hypothetical protein V1850_06715 [Candidatus Bathyarchaeota archaeon]
MNNREKNYGEEQIRGRPRGNRSYSSISVLSSVAQIAARYSLDPGLLLNALTEAWTHEESEYGVLKIKRRKVDQDFATFLITCNDKVVWQFPIDIGILKGPESFKSYIPIIPVSISKGDSTPKQISDLRNKMRGITVKAKILEVPPKALVNTRYGWEAYVSNVLLADKTGTIRLSLWNNQINDVAVGDTVSIEKAKVITFYGELQLRIGRSGTMSVDTSTRETTV